MLRRLAMAGVLLLVPAAALAQATWMKTPEVRPFVGAWVPTGDQRDDFKDALFTGAQLAFELHQNVHLVGSFGWSPGEYRPMARLNRVDVYQYDVGGEFFSRRDMNADWQFRPFVGLGAGVRTYHLREFDTRSKNYPAGYATVGAEFQLGRGSLRLEGRDYLSRYEGIRGGEAYKTVNDVFAAGSFAIHFW